MAQSRERDSEMAMIHHGKGSHAARLWLVACTAVLMLMGMAGTARAEFGITEFSVSATANASADSYTQAGGHPYAVNTSIDFTTTTHPVWGDHWPEEPVKDVFVDLPPGLVGNPTALERCTMAQLTVALDASAGINGPMCPAASQVGVAILRLDSYLAFFIGAPYWEIPTYWPTNIAIYNMVPPPGTPARFAFNLNGTIVTMDARVRGGSVYGLSIDGTDLSEGLPISGTTLTFWGVPGDDSHDPQRMCAGADLFAPGCSLDAPPKAFMTMPTSCPTAGGHDWQLTADSWYTPGVFDSTTDTMPATTGCESVPFTPSFTAQPASPAAHQASGYVFDLSIPQNDEPDQLAQSHLRTAVVTLPEGVRISPSSANGLGACSPAQIKLEDTSSPTCPDSSKVGTVQIDTPLLEEPLSGGIFLATPHENPFGSLLSIYLVAEGPGVVIKLPGEIALDPATGRLTATFDENPQLPFSNLHLEFFGGARAALTNPPTCGTYTTSAVLTGWSGKTVTSSSSFTTSADGNGAPCPAAQFTPGFTAGSVNPVAGASTPFTLTFSRDDADEELREVTVDMPEGLTARIANVTGLCPEVHAAAGTCDDASLVGKVTTSAGPGSEPYWLPGKAYMAGPYKGAPFSLSMVVPAIAGPFDLGTVVVRAAVHVDRKTSALRIVSDQLPTILQGIPLQIRSVNVLVDKPDFMLNPTDCDVTKVAGRIGSTTGKVADVSSRYKVLDCTALGFAPRMSLAVGGEGRTRAGASTPFTARLRMPQGNANLQSVKVTLPLTLNARLDVIQDACSLAEFEAGTCGADARAGSATAVTPLLRDPLRGSAYFVKHPARVLPDLMVALEGQVDIDLTGKVKIIGSKRLSTTFDTIPDVPISSFTLRLVAGENGPLGVARDLCSKPGRKGKAKVRFTAQSGKQINRSQRLKIRGCTG